MSDFKKPEPVKARCKRVVRVVPVIERAVEKCERVGDKVAYPPFLMQYDARTEGERAVKARLNKAKRSRTSLFRAALRCSIHEPCEPRA